MKIVPRNILKLRTDGNSMYNSLSLLWLKRSFMVLYLTGRWITRALVLCRINSFNLQTKTRIVTKVCRVILIARAERLTVLWDESTAESTACIVLSGSETKSIAWYKKLLLSVHNSKFFLFIMVLHFLLYNFNTAVSNFHHVPLYHIPF